MRAVLPLMLLLSVPILAGLHPKAQAVAMVTDAQGETLVGADSKPLNITQELDAGAAQKLKAGAKVTLLVYGTGEEISLSGPGAFTVGAKGVVSGPASGIRHSKGPGLSLKESLKPGGLAQASLVMRGPFDIELEEPTQPVVRAAHPSFRWTAVQGASTYTFSLRQADGPVLHTATTPTNHLELPANIQLQVGVTYLWSLSTDLPGVRTLTSEGDLSLLDPSHGQVLDELKAKADQGFAARLVYASTLQVFGLSADAKREWRALSALRPDDAVLKSYAR